MPKAFLLQYKKKTKVQVLFHEDEQGSGKEASDDETRSNSSEEQEKPDGLVEMDIEDCDEEGVSEEDERLSAFSSVSKPILKMPDFKASANSAFNTIKPTHAFTKFDQPHTTMTQKLESEHHPAMNGVPLLKIPTFHNSSKLRNPYAPSVDEKERKLNHEKAKSMNDFGPHRMPETIPNVPFFHNMYMNPLRALEMQSLNFMSYSDPRLPITNYYLNLAKYYYDEQKAVMMKAYELENQKRCNPARDIVKEEFKEEKVSPQSQEKYKVKTEKQSPSLMTKHIRSSTPLSQESLSPGLEMGDFERNGNESEEDEEHNSSRSADSETHSPNPPPSEFLKHSIQRLTEPKISPPLSIPGPYPHPSHSHMERLSSGEPFQHRPLGGYLPFPPTHPFMQHPGQMHPGPLLAPASLVPQSSMSYGGGGRPRDPTKPPPVKKYKCDVCGKAFSRSNTLVTHKRIHTGEKPFSCEVCGRAFRQPGNLTRHRLTHTTVKPYVCTCCKKAFNRASNLHTHMRTHTNFKPFVCPYCGKGFHQKIDMKIHSYTHTGEKPHKCHVCGRGFKQLTHLTYHLRTH